MLTSTQHSEHLKTVRSKEVAVVFWSRCELTFQTSSRTNTLILNQVAEPTPMRVIAKQAAVSNETSLALREAAACGGASRRSQMRPWSTKLKLRPRLVSRRGQPQS